MIPFIEKLLNRRKHHARPKKIKAKQGHCWRGNFVPSKRSLGLADADMFVYDGVCLNNKRKERARSKFYNARKDL